MGPKMDSPLRYFGCNRFVSPLVDPTGRILKGHDARQFDQQCVLSRFFSLYLFQLARLLRHHGENEKATAEELDAGAESNGL